MLFARLALATLLVGLGATSPALADKPITTGGLLAEMTDLRHVASFPAPAYTTRQFSSHDPKSQSADDHKSWFANGDFDHWLRTEETAGRTERLMLEANEPGAIVRIWSANPAGTMRVYIDGAEKPVIETPMGDLLSGKVPGYPVPIAGVYAKGFNLYLPIAYAKSCKITTDAKGFYYLIDYRTYPADTQVTSFKAEDIKELSAEIDRQAKLLASPEDAGIAPDETASFDVKLAPGETKSLGQFSGARAITQLRVTLGEMPSDAALRGTVLRITFDGEPTVEVPLGDFFGTAPGINAYASLPLGMTSHGDMYSHWFMPFRESATVEVENLSDEPIQFTGEVGTVASEWTDRSMHFNAGFRSEYDVSTRPEFDWNYLTAKGKGVFAGAAFAIDNPTRAWWGEGDEKIYVDGESQPSWFGTGTEDYYGYAWCWPGLFHHAYHNQPRCDGPNNYGRSSVNRFHIMDRIPFDKSFKFDMEILHWKKVDVNLAVTTYWYAMPGGTDDYKTLAKEDLAVRPMEAYTPPVVAGAIEGETMQVLQKTADVAPQEIEDTSNGSHMWWHGDVKPEDELVLGFDVPQAGEYQLVGRFLSADDYGIVRLAVNGKPLIGSVDFYNDGVKASDEMNLGKVELTGGQNKLTVTMLGANPKAKKAYFFGLDYLKLEPVNGAAAK